MNTTDFSSLNLRPELLENLATLDFHTMTDVQAKALPLILAGRDVIAQAKTGSGKTAAFALGLLQNLDVKRFRVQALVLCPTRELADQVGQEIRRLARAVHNIKVLTLCGGAPFGPQLGSLEHGAHIVVGTPGRIEEHLVKGSLKLEDINTLVLDEADRMLDMGFQPALEAIVSYLPKQRQNLLFSATFAPPIRAIAERFLQDPAKVELESTHDQTTISQTFFRVEGDAPDRLTALRLLLVTRRPDSTLVFANTKAEVQQIADELKRYGFSALALHGDLVNRITTLVVGGYKLWRTLCRYFLPPKVRHHYSLTTERHSLTADKRLGVEKSPDKVGLQNFQTERGTVVIKPCVVWDSAVGLFVTELAHQRLKHAELKEIGPTSLGRCHTRARMAADATGVGHKTRFCNGISQSGRSALVIGKFHL